MISNENNGKIVIGIIEAINQNSVLLSEIDGLTGDGDHGINMNKGFQLAGQRITEEMSFSESLRILGRTLIMDIGGSMGPIYGTMFSKMSKRLKECKQISSQDLYYAIQDAVIGLEELAGAKAGDKTLIDTLIPCTLEMKKSLDSNCGDLEVIDAMRKGAYEGKESTKNMQARVGRAARLGERSIGYLDAGATSCWIIIDRMGVEIQSQL